MRLLVSFVLLCLMSSVCAAGDYTPIQPAQSGLWFDSASNGSGFDFNIYDNGANRTVFVVYFDGVSGLWYFAQGTPTRLLTRLPLMQGGSAVGTLDLASYGCGRVVANATVLGQTKGFDLGPLLYDRGGGSCYTCVEPDFSPLPEGCGF